MTIQEALKKYKAIGKTNEWFDSLKIVYEHDGNYQEVKDFRDFIKTEIKNSVDVENNYNLLKKSYLLTARRYFDDYMIALEWNREPEKRFWLPRREILLPVVDAIQDLIDDKLDLLTISLPAGTGKTTLKTYLHSMLIGMNPDRPNLDSGHSGTMTQSTYDGVLSILKDSDYAWGEIFPEHKEIITNAKELTIDIDKKHRFSSLTCRAIGASLTGATRCEGVLSADDLVSGIEEAMSKDRLDKKWEAYSNDLKTRKKLGAKELHIATRWSVNDVIGRLQRQYEGDSRARFIVVPALNEKGESNFDYKYGVGFDTKYFLDMKEILDDASFKALFMNEPIEREGLLYTPDSITTYYQLPEGEPDAIFGVCDTAEGGGDDTVLPVFYQYGNKHYLVDCVCSDALPNVTDALCAKVLLKNKVHRCQFESNSAGGRTADKVQEMVKKENGRTSITKKRTTANKETKIFINSDWVIANCVFPDQKIIESGSMMQSFMRKMFSYTAFGKNKHDDVVDSLAQYALFIQDMVGNYAEIKKRFF